MDSDGSRNYVLHGLSSRDISIKYNISRNKGILRLYLPNNFLKLYQVPLIESRPKREISSISPFLANTDIEVLPTT